LHASAGLPQCLDAVKADYDAMVAAAEVENAKGGRIARGVGVACMWYGCGNTSMSNPSRMRITLTAEGKLT
uniref:molybdopterin-dependent oxidoreductase n=1 Tax=Stenotrophomonas maltophilia TaxID=40324 RepID=UPI0013DA9D67